MTGSQEPRIRIEPKRLETDGTDAGQLMETYGNRLDAWQQMVVDCWLGKDDSGEYNVTSAGLSVPRQNGKNVCIETLELYCLLINGERFLHTAHQVRTSKRSFKRLVNIFTNRQFPEIQEEVKNIRYTNGEEAIELKNGGMVEFLARSRQAARGFDGISLVVYDEAQELTDDQVEAIMATLSASATGNRQIIYTGTPPYPGCPGDVFRRRRTVSIENAGKRDAWHEWSVAGDSIKDIKVDDKTLWYACNPALGIRLSEDFTEEEMRSMSADGFARERLGWWSPVLTESADYIIPVDVWDSCMSADKKPDGKTAYGVKISADGAIVCLCGAVIPKEGKARITMIEARPTGLGYQWLADWLVERYDKASCVVIDGRNGVDVLIDKISGKWLAKGSVIRPRANDVIAACGMLVNALNEQTVTWYEGQDELRESAITSVKRPIGGGFGFGGDNATPIEAAALALYGAKISKRDPSRKMLIG